MFGHDCTRCVFPSWPLQLQDPISTTDIRGPVYVTISPIVIPGLQMRATLELSADAGTPFILPNAMVKGVSSDPPAVAVGMG